MLYIDRERGDWERFRYVCRQCGVEESSVASIQHADGCPVGVPDYPVGPLHESTGEDIRRILNVACEIYQEPNRWPEPDDFVDLKGVKWSTQGSTSRQIIGLGRTSSKGRFHMSDHRSLVLKVDPSVRVDQDVTGVCGNVDELHTYETAVRTGTRQYFADIVTCARDGAWLVMNYCIPIYPVNRDDMYNRDGIWDSDKEYIGPLLAAMRSDGWSGFDYKHGNIGLGADGVARLIDYGSGPDFSED